MATDLSPAHMKLVEQLRTKFAPKLTPQYDTDHNLYRWLLAYDFDYDKAALMLNRHLQMRILMSLDTIVDRPITNKVITDHVPMGFLGESGLNDNKFVMIECVGRADTHGLMKAGVVGEFALARLQIYEKALQAMQQAEKSNGKQAGVYYIYDMDKLEFDPTLLGVVLGPVRLMWIYGGMHYPELIHKTIIINGPSFLGYLLKAINPFLPRRTYEKNVILGKNWKEEIHKYISPDYLPVHWGGTMTDEDGDEMMRSRIVVPSGKLPKELYWSAKPGEPNVDDLTVVKIPAGGRTLWSTRITTSNVIVNWYLHTTHWSYTICCYVDGDDVELPGLKITPSETTSKTMRECFPPSENPPMPAVDHIQFPLLEPGVYHFKVGNESSWLRSLPIGYALRFSDRNDNTLSDDAVQPLNYKFQKCDLPAKSD